MSIHNKITLASDSSSLRSSPFESPNSGHTATLRSTQMLGFAELLLATKRYLPLPYMKGNNVEWIDNKIDG